MSGLYADFTRGGCLWNGPFTPNRITTLLTQSGSILMPDLIYLILGLAGFALAIIAVRAVERM